MNLDEAIQAHVAWKMKLSLYIKKPDGSLNPVEVEKDNGCALGKWVYSEGGAQHGKLPEFGELKSIHAQFHKAAADIIRKAASGAKVDEDMALGAKSPFGAHSSKVVQLLMGLKKKV